MNISSAAWTAVCYGEERADAGEYGIYKETEGALVYEREV